MFNYYIKYIINLDGAMIRLLFLLFLLSINGMLANAQTSEPKTLNEAKIELYKAEINQQKTEIEQLKKDVEARLEETKLKKENVDDKIIAQGERVDDLHKNLNVVLVFMSIITAIIVGGLSYFLYYKTKSLRKDFDNEKATLTEKLQHLDDIIKSKVVILNQEIDNSLKIVMAEIADKIEELDEFVSDFTGKSNEKIGEELQKANEILEQMKGKRSETEVLMDKIKNSLLIDIKKDPALEQAIVKQVEQTEEEKKERDYSANDWFLRGVRAVLGKRDKDACEYYKKAEALGKNDDSLYNNWGLSLSRLARKGKKAQLFEEAIQKFEKASKVSPNNNSFVYNNWGCALLELAKINNTLLEDKDEILEKLIRSEEQGNQYPTRHLVRLYSLLKKKSEAFEWMRKCFSDDYIEKLSCTRDFFDNDSDFDYIRDDKRYEGILGGKK